MRGMITDEINAKAKELMGYEALSSQELRLMPYLQYIIVNGQGVLHNRVNTEERAILDIWIKKGFISNVYEQLEMTKEFWNAISELIYLGYVNHD